MTLSLSVVGRYYRLERSYQRSMLQEEVEMDAGLFATLESEKEVLMLRGLRG